MIDENIEELSSQINDAQNKMKEFVLSKDISYAYFLGITGSGKSSTINYLLTEKLLGHEMKRGKFMINKP